MKIAIIGAGAIGKALEHILLGKGEQIELWDKNPAKAPNQKPISDIIPSAEIIFLCVAANAIREALQSVLPFLSSQAILVSVAKGLDDSSKSAMDLLSETSPRRHFAVLSGPMLADELMDDKGGGAVAASDEEDVRNKLSELFSGTSLTLETSDDVRGAAIGGILKNIYCIGLGILNGVGAGDDVTGMFVARALREMMLISKLFGGREETMIGLAGLGDLVASGFSPLSRNFQVGVNIGKRGESDISSEGRRAIPRIYERVRAESANLPLFSALYFVIVEKSDPNLILYSIISKQ
jgi:glycerol-3-phosphate dehydrogenase (NAD(P)+)